MWDSGLPNTLHFSAFAGGQKRTLEQLNLAHLQVISHKCLTAQSPSTNTMEKIWNGTSNLDSSIQNLALSMTNIVCTGTPLPRPEYDETAYQLGTTVQWKWLALPATMLLLSIGLVIAIIIQIARSPVEAWKSRPLAFLRYGVEQELKHGVYGRTNKYGGIENAVVKKKTLLTGTDEGLWKFRTA